VDEKKPKLFLEFMRQLKVLARDLRHAASS
jgi:hypothetical protein